jgi:hypothetical protein
VVDRSSRTVLKDADADIYYIYAFLFLYSGASGSVVVKALRC